MGEKNCNICGKSFKSNWRRAKYCSTDCKLQANKRYYKPKPDKETWFSIVEFINERDNYSCVKCNSGKNIVVHHKVHLCDKGTNEPDNLITLCAKCHAKEHNL